MKIALRAAPALTGITLALAACLAGMAPAQAVGPPMMFGQDLPKKAVVTPAPVTPPLQPITGTGPGGGPHTNPTFSTGPGGGPHTNPVNGTGPGGGPHTLGGAAVGGGGGPGSN